MPPSTPVYYLQTLLLCTMLTGYARPSSSHLALLSGTLKKFHKHACDGNTLNIECPSGTLISIVGATYERSTNPDYLCLPNSKEHSLNGASDDECSSSAAFITVVNACQEKQACKMVVSPRTLGGDPCPGVRKLASVEHRCRPRYFKRKVICEGQTIKLKCPRDKRLAIFSAEFGRTEKDKVLECPLPDEMKEKSIKDCQASYATETVLKMCHGKQRCAIPATTGTFGDPCLVQNLNLYLRVEFTCVPTEILKDDFKENSDAGSGGEDVIVPNVVFPHNRNYESSTQSPGWPMQPPIPSFTYGPGDVTVVPPIAPTNDTDMQSDETGEENGTTKSPNSTDAVVISSSNPRVIGFVTEWISAISFIKDNKEKFILYVTLSICAGVLMLLIVLSLRLYYQKKKKPKHSTKMNISDPVPSMFADDSSELEHFGSECTDHPDSIEVVRYTNKSTMQRQDSDSHPRAPVSMSLNNYYYS